LAAPVDISAFTGSPVAPAARSRLVELILAQPPRIERAWLTQFLRRDCGIKKCAFHVTNPEGRSPMSASDMAKAIRKAADRMTGCLIVEPLDDPQVREALDEARTKGLPIILLDTPVPSSGKPFTTVAFTGFAEASKAIVQSLKEEAARLRLPASGTALMLENRDNDVYSRQRMESLKGALNAAGIAYEVLAFQGDAKVVGDLVLKHLDAHPGVTMILGGDDFAMGGIQQARTERKSQEKPRVVAGGYAAFDEQDSPLVRAGTEFLADCSISVFSRKALQLALDLMDGKSAPERVDVEIPLIRNGEPYLSRPTVARPIH
jgi:ABC-type sugar transport system substrate-binding protein